MSKVCEICGKTSTLITPRNKLRGKYNPAEKKRKYPNLQWAIWPNQKKRVKACVQCIKTLSKIKKSKRSPAEGGASENGV